MVNPINGLPPVLLENTVQEVEPNNRELGKESLTTTGKARGNAQSQINTDTALQKTEADKQSAQQNAEEQANKVDFSKLANIVKTTIGEENYSIEFKRDEESEEMVMQVIDNETKEIVKQFPPELTLKISKIVAKLMETTGQVMNAKV